MQSRIMYIEDKSEGLTGPGRIGRVTFSRSGRTLSYRGRSYQRTTLPSKANHVDIESGQYAWISGPRRDGRDQLYPTGVPVPIDEDVREEYWTTIRGLPHLAHRATTR